MKFPERVYTAEEVEKAKRLVDKGYRHHLTVQGSMDFKRKVNNALNLIKTARHHDFLRMYIRSIVEIDGLSQLREEKAVIWANRYMMSDPIKAAGFLIQKAFQMKNFLEGKIYYGGEAERRAVEKRVEFLRDLKKRGSPRIRKGCEESLKRWTATIYF